jgi:hypothetical protein
MSLVIPAALAAGCVAPSDMTDDPGMQGTPPDGSLPPDSMPTSTPTSTPSPSPTSTSIPTDDLTAWQQHCQATHGSNIMVRAHLAETSRCYTINDVYFFGTCNPQSPVTNHVDLEVAPGSQNLLVWGRVFETAPSHAAVFADAAIDGHACDIKVIEVPAAPIYRQFELKLAIDDPYTWETTATYPSGTYVWTEDSNGVMDQGFTHPTLRTGDHITSGQIFESGWLDTRVSYTFNAQGNEPYTHFTGWQNLPGCADQSPCTFTPQALDDKLVITAQFTHATDRFFQLALWLEGTPEPDYSNYGAGDLNLGYAWSDETFQASWSDYGTNQPIPELACGFSTPYSQIYCAGNADTRRSYHYHVTPSPGYAFVRWDNVPGCSDQPDCVATIPAGSGHYLMKAVFRRL